MEYPTFGIYFQLLLLPVIIKINHQVETLLKILYEKTEIKGKYHVCLAVAKFINSVPIFHENSNDFVTFFLQKESRH